MKTLLSYQLRGKTFGLSALATMRPSVRKRLGVEAGIADRSTGFSSSEIRVATGGAITLRSPNVLIIDGKTGGYCYDRFREAIRGV